MIFTFAGFGGLLKVETAAPSTFYHGGRAVTI